MGFTLIEILVVIAIIASLSAVSYPVYRGIANKAKEQACRVIIAGLEQAVENFETEYNYMPYFQTDYPTADTLYKSQDGDVSKFITELVGLTSISNFKKIEFLGEAEISGATATVIDPWGNELQRIRVDHDGDGQVPWHYGSFVPVSPDYDPIRKKVALISFGRDDSAGSWAGGTHEDNLHNFPVPW